VSISFTHTSESLAQSILQEVRSFFEKICQHELFENMNIKMQVSLKYNTWILAGMEIRFEECVAIFRVCRYTNFILRSNMIDLRSNFSQQFFLFSVHLKFDIISMRFEPVSWGTMQPSPFSNVSVLLYWPNPPYLLMQWPGMEITGIASQFAMQSRPICDTGSNMRRNNSDALGLLGYARYYFSGLNLVSSDYRWYTGSMVTRW